MTRKHESVEEAADERLKSVGMHHPLSESVSEIASLHSLGRSKATLAVALKSLKSRDDYRVIADC